MTFSDLIIPILIFGLLINTYCHKSKLERKDFIEIAIAFLIMGFSVYNSDEIDTLTSQNKTLQTNVNGIKDSLNNIGLIVNDRTGKLLVIDSQLLKKGISKITNNNKNFFDYSSSTSLNEPVIPPTSDKTPIISSLDVSDSENIKWYLTANGDSLIAFPKNGVWIKAFVTIDSSLYPTDGDIFESDGMGQPEGKNVPIFTTKVDGKTFRTYTYHYNIVRSKRNPLIMNISKHKNQWVIFGDESNDSKRYLYEKGKVRWMPLTE